MSRRRPTPRPDLASGDAKSSTETVTPDVTVPDLTETVRAEVAKALAPPPVAARRCDFCGGFIEATGGRNYGPDWACSHCCKHTQSDDSADTIMDHECSRMVGMAARTYRVGSGSLISKAPPGDPAGQCWGHINVAELRQAWLARYGDVPPDEVDRMRMIVEQKRQLVAGYKRQRAARMRQATKEMQRMQKRIAQLAALNGHVKIGANR